MKIIGILYHPKLEEARKLSERLFKSLQSSGYSAWFSSAWEEDESKKHLDKTELILSIGGDGTVLRSARIVQTKSIPILGINMGRLGFMTELSASEAETRLPALLSEQSWIDERAMIQATLDRSGQTFHALNDIVVARGNVARAINVDISIDGIDIASHRLDAAILATATGSTAYSLAAGGPILYPESQDMLLQPLASHLGLVYGLVLPANTIIKIKVHSYHPAIVSIDGQINLPLEDGEKIEVKRSPFLTRFLRFQPRKSFYYTLAQRLVGK